MEIIIIKPIYIDEDHLNQIIELIILGGQIKSDRIGIKALILLADLIAYKLDCGVVICTATLKNQYPVYREKVFNLANAPSSEFYTKELGYIVTHPDYENQGHCRQLLSMFFNRIRTYTIFATTRKPQMIHLLSNLGFQRTGIVYGNDLSLLTYDSRISPGFQNIPGNLFQDQTPINDIHV